MPKLTYTTIDDDGNEITTIKKNKKGRRPTLQILRYRAKLGDSEFIVHGHRPTCAICGSKDLAPCVEIEQPDMFQKTHFTLVMQCKKCSDHTVFKYILESRTE